MFVAVGVGARRTDLGMIEVTVDIYDNRVAPQILVKRTKFTGADVNAVRATILVQLQTMKDNENDQALNNAVAGQTLAQV
jgi:hypothetical protein